MTFTLFQRRTLKGRRWFFNARAGNGEIILQSEGYRNFDDAMATIALIRTEAASAPVHIQEKR